jgi:sugar phosphate permease
MSSARPRPTRVHCAWITLGAVCLVLMAASGIRASFGVFIKPLQAQFGWDRASLAMVASLSLLLYGAAAPFVGRVADRAGARRALVVAMAVLGAGVVAASQVQAFWQLVATVGIVASVGAGGAAQSVGASLAMRWFEKRRGIVLGILGGSLAAGQLIVVPGAMAITQMVGWRAAYLALGAAALAIVAPFAWWAIRNDPADVGARPYGASGAPGAGHRSDRPAAARIGVIQAARTGPFWLLAGSFFVCGYTTTGLVLTHFIPHATDHGFHAGQAAEALGIMGILNVAGTLASGWASDRFGAKLPLAAYYLLRGASLVVLPFIETTPALFTFAAVYGLNYISTVPATTALTARLYGKHSVGELSGWIFLAHQIGSALGALVGGVLFDRYGDYTLAFHSAAALAFMATALVLAIPEATARRPAAVAPAAGR